jgi:hypothetical protein
MSTQLITDDIPSAEELAKFQAENPISKEELQRANKALAAAVKRPPSPHPHQWTQLRIQLVEEEDS